MEAKDFLKSKKIWLGTKVADMNAPENYFNLEDLLEGYHQAKLKLLDIPAVINSVCPFCNSKETEDNQPTRHCRYCNQDYGQTDLQLRCNNKYKSHK